MDLVDTSCTFIFRQGIPGKCLGKRPIINPPIHAQARGMGGWIWNLLLRHFPPDGKLR